MVLIEEEDFPFLRGGDVLYRVRNKHMEDFCKEYYSEKENYKYYEDQAPEYTKIIVECPSNNGSMQVCEESHKRFKKEGVKWMYGSSVYPNECSPSLFTEIKILKRKYIDIVLKELYVFFLEPKGSVKNEY